MSFCFRSFLLLLCLSTLCWASEPQSPFSPSESLKRVRLADPALSIELVVSEPHIDSPVAITWDADGAMYVTQMSDYPTAETGGSIRRLVDRDRDGTFERVTTFASNLRFPSGALPWNGGLLVTCAPDILFFKDADSDGIAEHREVLFTGFVEGNQQLRVNGLIWGLDNLVYGANGRSGGSVTSAKRPSDPPVSIARHDFRFDPVSGKLEALAGFSQFGLGRDDFNHRFLSWNTLPFRQAVIEEQDLNRNPLLNFGESIALIAEPGDTGRIYPVSSPPKTFNRERTDYFNASCGLMAYRGLALGEKYRGNAFVCEPLTNIVHRKILEQHGPLFVARRGETEQEFLASSDNWTHPVFIAMGPDDSLYIADFYREWVEHPQFVQEALRQGVDFRVGNQHGRIWRIRQKNSPPSSSPFSLSNLATADLTELLISGTSGNSKWTRETSQRLLVERQDLSVVPQLESSFSQTPDPATRAAILWTLQGLNSLSPQLVSQALSDSDPRIRTQSIQLTRRHFSSNADLLSKVLNLATDPDPEVRFHVALAAGDHPSDSARTALASVSALDSGNPWTRLAIYSSLGTDPFKFLQALKSQNPAFFHNPDQDQRSLLKEVVIFIAAQGNPDRPELVELTHLIGQLQPTDSLTALTLLSALGEGLSRAGTSLSSLLENPPSAWQASLPTLRKLIQSTPEMTLSSATSPDLRLLAWQILLRADPATATNTLPHLLTADQPPALQTAAARALGELASADLASILLDSWGTYSLNTRRELLTALARRRELAPVLLDGIEQEKIPPREVDFTTREALSRLPDPAIRTRSAQLLSPQGDTNRQAIIEKFTTAATLPAQAEKGASLFAQHCAVCHQMRGEGARVGPDLSGIASRPKPAILVDVFDPGREVSPDFVNYVILTRSGQVFMGLLSSETPAGIRLKRQQGAEDFIPRSEIEELRVNAKSLMPEGFEERFSIQDVANLLEFLHHPTPLPKP